MQYISDKQAAARYHVTRQTIWRWVRDRKFPAPVSLSPGCTRWRLSDIEAWEAGK
ncbi:MAG: prophage regulatory protein [Paracoccaceae bacterium]|jgi:prophage regulatory protein